jgi:hypothetical protein
MSVGGTVVDVVKVHAEKWWVNTFDKADSCCRTVAVYVDPNGEAIEVGDALWWQGEHAYWTPRIRPDGRVDVKLRRRGYSGVAHPDEVERLRR